jgi:2-polyprenyl-3-methyl-5-hydroxy-6-metoxy-1,4-benzoquinol methylase
MAQPNNDEVRTAWESNAQWWDAYYKEGNDFHLMLIAPPTERLLGIESEETILDVACGNGAFSRRLAELGARVVAFDFSEPFIECARKRTVEHSNRIEYHVVDATDRDRMLALGEGRFDAAVCTMAIMDMEKIEPLAEVIPRLLKAGGRFVFSILHPCFNNPSSRMAVEQEDRGGKLVLTHAVKVTRYMTPFSAKGIGILGQPVPQTYFHRPLHVLLAPFFRNGLVVDGLEETAFTDPSNARGPLSWDHYPEIPPVLVVRLRAVAVPGDRG